MQIGETRGMCPVCLVMVRMTNDRFVNHMADGKLCEQSGKLQAVLSHRIRTRQ